MSTTCPAAHITIIAPIQRPVPCIKRWEGQTHRPTLLLDDIAQQHGVLVEIRRHIEIEAGTCSFGEHPRERTHLLEHTLRIPGGPAGVQHVQVVFAALDPRRRLVGIEDLVIASGSRDGGSRSVVDRDEERQLRELARERGSTRSASDEWNTIASASQLSRMYSSSASRYR